MQSAAELAAATAAVKTAAANASPPKGWAKFTSVCILNILVKDD